MCLSSPVTYCQSELPLKETTTLGLGNHGLDSRFSSGKLCGSGTLVDKLYKLDCVLSSELHNVGETAAMAVASCNIDLWHQRLGHLCEQQIKCMVEKRLASGINYQRVVLCIFVKGVLKGKCTGGHLIQWEYVHRKGCNLYTVMYADPCQLSPLEDIKYFVTFIDDFQCCCAIYFLNSEVFNKFNEFEKIPTSPSMGSGMLEYKLSYRLQQLTSLLN